VLHALPIASFLTYQDFPAKFLHEFLSSLIRNGFESRALIIRASHLEIEIRSGDALSWLTSVPPRWCWDGTWIYGAVLSCVL
jgi:hypothetical protein